MLTDIHGNLVEVDCIACAIGNGSLELPGGIIAESLHFRLEQDLEVPIAGFLVLVAKRHIYSFDEMDLAEQQDYINFLATVRAALRKVGVSSMYYVLEEDTSNSHFHLWIVPKHEWMAEFGRGIASIRPSMEFAKREMKTEENLANVHALVDDVRRTLL